MKIVRHIPALRRVIRAAPRPIVLVPTMGALHAGHLALVKRARKLAGAKGTVVASVFVNPTQFGPHEDFNQYPRPFQRDRRFLAEHGTDLLFAPSTEAMYAGDRSVVVEESSLSNVLCGASRPGHFGGVCTVVTKLFHLVQPDSAVFGEKDFQQLAIIRRLVRDLNFPIRIVGHPTVREADGLAMSSRNAYLTPEEREQAPAIYRMLKRAEAHVRAGKIRGGELERWMKCQIEQAPLARVDYVAAVDPSSLQKTLTIPVLLAAAVFFGKTRLIDNRLVQ